MARIVKVKRKELEDRFKKKFGSKFQWLKPGEEERRIVESHFKNKHIKSWLILLGIIGAGGVIIFLLIPGNLEMTAGMISTATTTITTTTTTSTTATTPTTTSTTITTTTTLGPPHMLALGEISCENLVIEMTLKNVGEISKVEPYTDISRVKFYVNGEKNTAAFCNDLILRSGDSTTCKIIVERKGLYEVEVRGLIWLKDINAPNVMRENVRC